MKVFDVIIEYPNGVTDLYKSEVAETTAKRVIKELMSQLTGMTDGYDYTIYYVRTQNTIRKCFKVVENTAY